MQIFMKIDHKKKRTLFFFMPLVNVFAADCTRMTANEQVIINGVGLLLQKMIEKTSYQRKPNTNYNVWHKYRSPLIAIFDERTIKIR